MADTHVSTAEMLHPLPRFYPSDRLTLPYTIVDSGISLSHVVAAPLAAGCLSLTGLGGLQGWQWLFLLEGAPTLVLALVMLRRLPNSPEQGGLLISIAMSGYFVLKSFPCVCPPCVSPAPFLQPHERAYLASRLAGRKAPHGSLMRGRPPSGSGSTLTLLPKLGEGAGSGHVHSHVQAGSHG